MMIDNTITFNSNAIEKRRSSAMEMIKNASPVDGALQEYFNNFRRASRPLADIIQEFEAGIPKEKAYEKIFEFYSKKADIARYIALARHSLIKLRAACEDINKTMPKIPKDKNLCILDQTFSRACRIVSEQNDQLHSEPTAMTLKYYNKSSEKVHNGVRSLVARWRTVANKGLPSDRIIVADRILTSLQFYEAEARHLTQVYEKLGFFERLKVNEKVDFINAYVTAAKKEIGDCKPELEKAVQSKEPTMKRLTAG